LFPRSAFLLSQRTTARGTSWWTDRGRPVDRYYIERFLAENRRFVKGVCLEVADSDYTREFGNGVERADVLDIDASNPQATVVGDLRKLDGVRADTYDCFICTQTLQYLDDIDAGLREIARILKPGGTALVTLPSMQKMDRPENPDCWRFTLLSTQYLFRKVFPDDHLEIKTWGNVFSGMACWIGLAQEDMSAAHLDQHDPAYPCIVSVRATKPASRSGA
jgi:SAM-dependent methyltransferase